MADRGDLLPGEIKKRLATRVFGRRVYYLPEIDSTNRLAVELARAGEPHGTMVVADYQTSGKGRWNRRWESPRGRNVLFSMILRPDASAGKVLPLTLALSVGVAEAIEAITGRKVGVKWPNDVTVGERKISGILLEGSTRGLRTAFVVAGIGVNVNAASEDFGEELRDRSCSCLTLTGTEWHRADVLARILSSLESAYDGFARDGFQSMAGRYKASLTVLGKSVRFKKSGEVFVGTVVDIAADGGLVVGTGAGTLTLYEEEVFGLRSEGTQ